jgi:hypothetical protein
MTTPYTFGFEAEFATPAHDIVRELNSVGLLGASTMHNYTCDCDVCEVSVYDPESGEQDFNHEDIWPLRAKFDSSCGGEIISKVFSRMNDACYVFDKIESAAVKTDTEPGLAAGFHVHVGRRHMSKMMRGKLVVAMAMWEPILFDISAGRWPHNRGWNTSLTSLLSDHFYSEARDAGINNFDFINNSIVGDTVETLKSSGESMIALFYRRTADEHMNVDRHSSMAFSPRWPTMEFRLWNSTRAAWRMQLWCRLSRLLVNPEFIDSMIDAWTPDVTMRDFVALIEPLTNQLGLFQLITRQVDYVENLHKSGISQYEMAPFSNL